MSPFIGGCVPSLASKTGGHRGPTSRGISIFLSIWAVWSQSSHHSIFAFHDLCISRSVFFSICAFLNLCFSQLVLFSISVFLNLCDSQLVFFSIKAVWGRHRQLDDSLVGQLTMTFQVTCEGQLSRFLQCLIFLRSLTLWTWVYTWIRLLTVIWIYLTVSWAPSQSYLRSVEHIIIPTITFTIWAHYHNHSTLIIITWAHLWL